MKPLKRTKKQETLNRVSALASPLLYAPFGGGHIWVKLRNLTSVQLRCCGDFSLIQSRVANRKKPSLKDIIYASNVQHAVVKESLLSPTYDELVDAMGFTNKIAEHKKAIAEMREKLLGTGSGPKRKQLEDEINLHEQWTENILYNDFTEFVFNFAVKKDESDIGKVSEEMLVRFAMLAERGHDNPAAHAHGKFTDFNYEDINEQAWAALDDARERNK